MNYRFIQNITNIIESEFNILQHSLCNRTAVSATCWGMLTTALCPRDGFPLSFSHCTKNKDKHWSHSCLVVNDALLELRYTDREVKSTTDKREDNLSLILSYMQSLEMSTGSLHLCTFPALVSLSLDELSPMALCL